MGDERIFRWLGAIAMEMQKLGEVPDITDAKQATPPVTPTPCGKRTLLTMGAVFLVVGLIAAAAAVIMVHGGDTQPIRECLLCDQEEAQQRHGQQMSRRKLLSPPKKAAAALHPPYEQMVKAALVALKDRTGSSAQAIAKYMKANFKGLPDNMPIQRSKCLKRCVENEKLKKVT